MADTSEKVLDSTVPVERTILLDIPFRLQWKNGNGYCGETAIQCFGLYR